METDKTTEGAVDTQNNKGEGEATAGEVISISKKDYDTLNQTIGSLKRDLKDLKKPKEETKETPQKNHTDDNVLLQKLERMALRQAGLTHQEDVELARTTAKKWGLDIDEVIADEDFKVKLERQQTARTNVEATSNVRGTGATASAKTTPEYWIAKGVPPSAADIPDRKVRAKIARAMVANTKSSKTFYND